MTLRNVGKPIREWTDANGIRCVEVDDPKLRGEVMVDVRDLTKFLVSLDPSTCDNTVKRAALIAFQAEAPHIGAPFSFSNHAALGSMTSSSVRSSALSSALVSHISISQNHTASPCRNPRQSPPLRPLLRRRRSINDRAFFLATMTPT